MELKYYVLVLANQPAINIQTNQDIDDLLVEINMLPHLTVREIGRPYPLHINTDYIITVQQTEKEFVGLSTKILQLE